MDESTELNGLKYVGDVPMVYKGAVYEEFYEPLYVQMVGDKPFYAVKTDNGIEAVAIVKESSIPFFTKDRVFKYNAENDNICAKIPMYNTTLLVGFQ